jgi:hypothetical protein
MLGNFVMYVDYGIEILIKNTAGIYGEDDRNCIYNLITILLQNDNDFVPKYCIAQGHQFFYLKNKNSYSSNRLFRFLVFQRNSCSIDYH